MKAITHANNWSLTLAFHIFLPGHQWILCGHRPGYAPVWHSSQPHHLQFVYQDTLCFFVQCKTVDATYKDGNYTRSCHHRHCPPRKRFNWQTCSCDSCGNKQCPRGQVVDPRTCRCTCPNHFQCSPGQLFNPFTCECRCFQVKFCPGSQQFNPATCQCECPVAVQCPPGQFFSPLSCRCELLFPPVPRPPTLPPLTPQPPSPVPPTCSPSDIRSCRFPARFDFSRCRCLCPSDAERFCNRGQVLDFDTCECECPSNGRECNELQRLNPRTCECECTEVEVEIERTLTPRTRGTRRIFLFCSTSFQTSWSPHGSSVTSWRVNCRRRRLLSLPHRGRLKCSLPRRRLKWVVNNYVWQSQIVCCLFWLHHSTWSIVALNFSHKWSSYELHSHMNMWYTLQSMYEPHPQQKLSNMVLWMWWYTIIIILFGTATYVSVS